jgi:hypothetical protein
MGQRRALEDLIGCDRPNLSRSTTHRPCIRALTGKAGNKAGLDPQAVIVLAPRAC